MSPSHDVARPARSTTSLSLPRRRDGTPHIARRRTASCPPLHMHDDDDDDHTANRDHARRHHALAELVATELGYLLDLRVLVSVYLRLLPVLKIRSSQPFSRPPHPASLRTHSHPHLTATAVCPAVPRDSNPPRAEKCTARHLFSASDLDAITRNAEDILESHERLVHSLRRALAPLGISLTSKDIVFDSSDQSHGDPPVDVRRAISAVSSVFVHHAASFDQYRSFCSGHSEAFDIVRKVQHRHPAEWEAFELRCAALATETQLQDTVQELIPPSESARHLLDLSYRRHSVSSLEALSAENPRVHTLSASESGHTDRDTRKPRLMFMDYMIKPVQRVCRYPLLFDQLQDRNGTQKFNDGHAASSSDGHDIVKTALWTMRTVAGLVDDARRQQDLVAKSAQIVSRITQGLLTLVVSYNRPSHSASLSNFLSSLAPCHLSGSLDVIHYRGTNMARLGTVRAKYLGAFLFPGAFLVLVKVAKSRVYEPKHWFNLRLFELVDSNLDDVLLPSWFRLSSKAHMFEFAASCRREKDIWVDAIRRAIAEEVPWTDEPPSSLQAEFTVPMLENVPYETISPLPTIQSIPELDDIDSAPPVAQSGSQIHLRVEKDDIMVPSVATSRRSSVVIQPVSIPESNTFHLVRSTASAREHVDRGLLDVFSEKCLTARFHAHTHEEDLFEAQRVTRSFSRSTSALTMASAMSVAAKNKLTKRESVLVPRKKSFVEGSGTLGDAENLATSTQAGAPILMKRRQHPSKLKIVAMTSLEGEGGNDFLESPSPMSHCSSVSFVTPLTPLTIPVPLPPPSGRASSVHSHSDFLNVRQNDYIPKRSKSMIENVRGFFAPRPASPTTTLNRESSTRSSVSNSSLLRWWSRESLRRRVRSAPDVPIEELPSALTTRSLHVEASTGPLIATTDGPYSQPDLHCLLTDISEFGVGDLSLRKQGIFSLHRSRRRWTASALLSETHEEDSIPVPTRMRRNFSFLQRFTQGTRDSDDTPPA